MKPELVKFFRFLKESEDYSLAEFAITQPDSLFSQDTVNQINAYVAQVSDETGFNMQEHRDELITAVVDSIDNWFDAELV